MLKNVELSSVDGQKGDHDHRVLKTVVRVDKSSFIPDLLRYRSDFEDKLEEEENTRHDIDRNMAEDVADEAPAVENSHFLVPAKEWGAETRNVGKGGTDLFMYDEKSTSAKYMDANRANYTELDTGQDQEVVSKMVQVVAIEGDKKRDNYARRSRRQEVSFRG